MAWKRQVWRQYWRQKPEAREAKKKKRSYHNQADCTGARKEAFIEAQAITELDVK